MKQSRRKNKKVALVSSVKIDAYKIIDDAVESSVRYGFDRAHKHTDKPDKEHIIEEIHRQVMSNLCEIFKFEDENT